MRQGGRYVQQKGKTTLVERTRPHPEGQRPRDAKGRPLDATPQDQPRKKQE